jgi:nitrate/TMAO reductase-like tetraheme cytochrome c subunit
MPPDETPKSGTSVWRKLLIALPFALILLLLVMFGAARATEGNSFCGTSCHEMLPYNATWEASKHHEVSCVTCHIPPGLFNLAKTKFFALREVYVHFTMGDKAPITVTRKIPNVVCEDCHPSSDIPEPIPLYTASFSHKSHSKVPECVDCHAQLVHAPLPGVPYIPPQSMNGCFVCHNGKAQPNDCAYCHQAPHPDRGTCEQCHSLSSWMPGNFKHPVPLTGPHAQILCETCHTSATTNKLGPADGCINCHGNHHKDPKATECATCHTTAHFVPSTTRRKDRTCQPARSHSPARPVTRRASRSHRAPATAGVPPPAATSSDAERSDPGNGRAPAGSWTDGRSTAMHFVTGS